MEGIAKTSPEERLSRLSFILLPVQESSTHPRQKNFEKPHFSKKKTGRAKHRTTRERRKKV
ncbi:MAG: hypothetical protein IJK97_07880 [Thermoguttaceae bacterium]|nr:hypothetical protein [Thermoguttaceae bacterium]